MIIIAAIDNKNGIGKHNTIPWKLPEDMKFFKETTTGHPVIMGRKTFDSIGRPLPNRRNIVITRNLDWKHDGVEVVHSMIDAALDQEAANSFVIGGAEIYTQALQFVTKFLITEVHGEFDCDTFFPEFRHLAISEISRTRHTSITGQEYSLVTYFR